MKHYSANLWRIAIATASLHVANLLQARPSNTVTVQCTVVAESNHIPIAHNHVIVPSACQISRSSTVKLKSAIGSLL